MLRSKADRILDVMIRENGLATPDAPLSAEQEAKRRDRRTDLTIAALGVTLGLICALFPWYIFFNPDEFGVRAVRFGGGGAGTEPIILGAETDRIGAPAESLDFPSLELDLSSTGTAVNETAGNDTGTAAVSGLVEQPFPAPAVAFKVVQIANGRAMLEDDTGLFIVQPGSLLPDGARVETIGERDGRPVLVTDAGAVLGIEG
jgi:hypothetical protein